MTETFYIEREDNEITGLTFTVEIQAFQECVCEGGFDVGGTESYYWGIEESETKVYFNDTDVTGKLKKEIIDQITNEQELLAAIELQLEEV
jgi:hypothetical protein